MRAASAPAEDEEATAWQAAGGSASMSWRQRLLVLPRTGVESCER